MILPLIIFSANVVLGETVFFLVRLILKLLTACVIMIREMIALLFKYNLKTVSEEFVNITSSIKKAVAESRIKNGICVVYRPHTTAGIKINENADPDVVTDLLYALNKTYPDRQEFRPYITGYISQSSGVPRCKCGLQKRR